jgi:galactose mutarotase-like enzyme
MITLANDRVALTINPDFGARVTSLIALATGRQWLVTGDCVAGDAYLGDQARGWDECFPTVGVCTHPAWGGSMRDHGELWGRQWSVTQDADRCLATFTDARYTFARSLQLQGGTLVANYTVTNTSPVTLPYLWSQHALLATAPGDRIALHGITAIHAQGQPVDWPNHPARDLSKVGLPDEGFALKLYGDAGTAAGAEIIGSKGGIRFDWSGADIPAFGLWLDYGGWPPGAPVHQIALEPTTAPADDLAQAEAMGRARQPAPGETRSWTVRITVTP